MKSRLFNLFTFFALLVSVVGSALTATPAYAAGIVVNTAIDEDTNNANCSLREAITAANTDAAYNGCSSGAGADTITFAADYTITLTGSQLPAVTTDITINGNGAANTIVQANAAANTATYRVFEVGAGGNLTLDSLTVRHGRCNGTCNNISNMGGGILNNGTLTITNSTLSNNSASNLGGGILNIGTLTITNSTLSNNSSSNLGGGIHHSGTSAMLTNVIFSGNSASGGGGVGSNSSGNLTLTDVSFNSNTATTSGGGMFTSSSSTLTNVTFSGNSAPVGGGMYANGSITLMDVTFNANTATSQGGGLYSVSNSTLTNVTFSSNSATNNGGGMYSASNSTLTNVTFSGNSATNGGGISHFGGTLTVTSSTLSGNSATNGGGGIYSQGGTINITNSTFSGNSTNNEGGGLSKLLGTATIINTTFSGNSSVSNGGNLASYAGTTTLKNTIIANRSGGTSECLSNAGTLTADSTNIDTDGSCDNAVQKTSLELNLGSLQDNGGSTQTMALLPGSHAIDVGDAATCTNSPVSGKDQRGVTRPQGAGCDIGAYEFGPIIPVVTASNPSASAVLTSLSTINITFNQDMLNDSSAKAANNTANYLLVERGTNGTFDTKSCNGGRVADDVTQTISTATYSNLVFMSTLTLANPLTNGTYRLFICGTTSIWSVAGLELNNGANDATVDFTVNSATTTTTTTTGSSATSTTASSLPTTGFAPNKITTLPEQPANSAYAALGDLWLEIPSLNVKSSIVGVPQNKDNTWDVNWLGNDTGWLNGTAYPTWNGNSVLTAHVTNADGLDGPFASIKALQHGDQIIIHMGGAKYIYEIRSTKLARPYSTSFAFESLQDHSYLTLITCSGYNPINETYLFRRIVRAVLVEIK